MIFLFVIDHGDYFTYVPSQFLSVCLMCSVTGYCVTLATFLTYECEPSIVNCNISKACVVGMQESLSGLYVNAGTSYSTEIVPRDIYPFLDS